MPSTDYTRTERRGRVASDKRSRARSHARDHTSTKWPEGWTSGGGLSRTGRRSNTKANRHGQTTR